MVNAQHPPNLPQDASERPGAVMIRPDRNPEMIYDPETRLVTDMKTGDTFGASQHIRSGGVYSAGIHTGDGAPVYVYELRYGESRNPDKSIKRVIWEVFWSLRGEDAIGNFQEVQLPGRERAKNDSIERLAQFLRARREGVAKSNNRANAGETVVVDRRMDDKRAETIW